MKKFISIFLLLYITLPINAQDKTNELSGFIIHKQENGSNGSLDGANIFLIYAKDTLKTTSINGVFRFKPIKTGKAKLIIPSRLPIFELLLSSIFQQSNIKQS